MSSQEVTLEGFHAIKHALRFGAAIDAIYTLDLHALSVLCAQLAPDLIDQVNSRARVVPREQMKKFVRQIPHTGTIAFAKRSPAFGIADSSSIRPIIVLEDPRNLGNVGACIRVAAGMDSSGVYVIGSADPWHETCLRGSAGLNFALPVETLSLQQLQSSERQRIAFDAEGDALENISFDQPSSFIFGSERTGLTDTMLGLADVVCALPIQPGVSSYNLATSVAMALLYDHMVQRLG